MKSTDTFAELYYHFVWATKKRDPYITGDVEAMLYQYIHWKCARMNVFLYALGGMPDHIHLVCSVRPTLSVSDFMHDLKGSSAHRINHQPAEQGILLGWQPGYGVLTFSKAQLSSIVAYVANQKAHHSENTIKPKLEQIGETQNPSPLGGLS